MGRRGAIGALCVLALAGSAQAKEPGMLTYGVSIGGGKLTLDFHGDQASGCAQHGTCGVSGTITATTATSRPAFANLFALGSTAFANLISFDSAETKALVHTAGAPDCSDSGTFEIAQFAGLAQRHGSLAFGYGDAAFRQQSSSGQISFGSSSGSDPFASRCAGPVPDDYAAALPVTTLSFRKWRNRRFRADLRGTRAFAGGGFAGTVTSDFVLQFTRRRCQRARRAACRAFDRWLAKSA